MAKYVCSFDSEAKLGLASSHRVHQHLDIQTVPAKIRSSSALKTVEIFVRDSYTDDGWWWWYLCMAMSKVPKYSNTITRASSQDLK